MTKRAIIFSTTYYPLVGGAEIAMKEMTDRLPGWQLDLLCARIQPGLKSTERIGNVTVHRVGIGHPVDKYLLPVFGALRALFLPTPNVIWSLMASYGGFAALVYTWFRPRTRMLLTLQEGDPLEHYAKRMGRLQSVHEAIFKRANAVQAISRFLADWSVKMGFTGTPTVVPNGVDVSRFAVRLSPEERTRIRATQGYTENDIVIATVSRLSLKNGVDDLIRSFVHLPSSYKALIIGDGEDREKLLALTEEKQLKDRIQFLGTRGQEELPSLLQASDLFCRPSLSEGLGISFLEALTSGLPVIATPVGGIPEFLKDGETGVFCEPRNPESIARAAVRIMSEPGLRERLQRNGPALAKERYDWDRLAVRIDALLTSLV